MTRALAAIATGKGGYAIALQVPSEYFDAVIRGIPMSATDVLKFCPHCWQPGTTLEEIWLSPRWRKAPAIGDRSFVSCAERRYVIVALSVTNRLPL
ncbi:hypothetical protein [Nostoc sp. CHAB 5715]|uniref:hypothetical protein n=1 Tax=Nostoc sp. CHAB 5715 TaxID=2780400 RepID=UPI001E5427A3|nr:hypothetical protein [Nostoc sp. CHAB 5715]MCC5626180.1 hypothetical protein [Nostoc sp. CHAB 5715]